MYHPPCFNQIMDYKKLYLKIIEKGFKAKPHGYYERHHIKPKCLDGDDSKDNLVYLTARQHFLCHWLLCKIHPENRNLVYAFNCMTRGSGINHRYTSVSYKYAREKFAKVSSEAQKGKVLSEEHKRKISEAKKGKSLGPKELCPFFNKRFGVKHPNFKGIYFYGGSSYTNTRLLGEGAGYDGSYALRRLKSGDKKFKFIDKSSILVTT